MPNTVIRVKASECCDGSKAEILRHLTSDADGHTGFLTDDPYSRGEDALLCDLKDMGFTHLRVGYTPPGSTRTTSFLHAL